MYPGCPDIGVTFSPAELEAKEGAFEPCRRRMAQGSTGAITCQVAYMVPSSARVSQGGRYFYSHFIDEETEGQPQLMHSRCILTTVDAF